MRRLALLERREFCLNEPKSHVPILCSAAVRLQYGVCRRSARIPPVGSRLREAALESRAKRKTSQSQAPSARNIRRLRNGARWIPRVGSEGRTLGTREMGQRRAGFGGVL